MDGKGTLFASFKANVAHMKDLPLLRHRRLYWLMLRPWFPWQLRRWIENNILARIASKNVTVTYERRNNPYTD